MKVNAHKISIIFLVLWMNVLPAFSQKTFTSNQSGNWENASTWIRTGSGGGNNTIPGSTDFVVLKGNVQVTLNSAAEIRELYVESSGSVTQLNLGVNTLTINGFASGYSGTITNSVPINYAAITGLANGTLRFTGNQAANSATFVILKRWGTAFSVPNVIFDLIPQNNNSVSTKVLNGGIRADRINFSRGIVNIQRINGDPVYEITANLLLDISSGVTLNTNDNVINLRRSISNSGTFNNSTGTTRFGGVLGDQSFVNGVGVFNFGNVEVLSVGELVSPPIMNISGSFLNNGIVNASSNTINIGGLSLTNNGTFSGNGSTIVFNGTINQDWGGTSTSTLNNVTVSKSSGTLTVVGAAKSLNGILRINAGTITTNGLLTLISNSGTTASLIDNASSSGNGGSVIGNVRIQRWVPTESTLRQARYYSSPISNAIASDYQSNLTNFFFYEENKAVPTSNDENGLWTRVPSLSAAIQVGRGYQRRQNGNIITLTGTPNNGNISFPVTYTDRGWEDETQVGWNLLGNPYPSPILWEGIVNNNTLTWQSSNMGGAVALWDGNNGNYTYFNGLNPGTIPAFQGFFIQATGPSPVLVVKNPARVGTSGANNSFFRTAEASETSFKSQKSKSQDVNYLKVNIVGNSFRDAALIAFNENATDGHDFEFDAIKLTGLASAPQVYTKSEDNYKLAINTLFENNKSREIQLWVKVGVTGNYTISFDEIGTVFNGTIYFYDEVTGVLQNVKEKPFYSYNTNELDVTKRFKLIFESNEDNGIELPVLEDGYKIFYTNNKVHILIPGEKSAMNVAIYDTFGKIYYNNFFENPLYKTNIDFTGIKSGVYIVRVNFPNKVISEKILVR
jgi:hypothetical protein